MKKGQPHSYPESHLMSGENEEIFIKLFFKIVLYPKNIIPNPYVIQI